MPSGVTAEIGQGLCREVFQNSFESFTRPVQKCVRTFSRAVGLVDACGCGEGGSRNPEILGRRLCRKAAESATVRCRQRACESKGKCVTPPSDCNASAARPTATNRQCRSADQSRCLPAASPSLVADARGPRAGVPDCNAAAIPGWSWHHKASFLIALEN